VWVRESRNFFTPGRTSLDLFFEHEPERVLAVCVGVFLDHCVACLVLHVLEHFFNAVRRSALTGSVSHERRRARYRLADQHRAVTLTTVLLVHRDIGDHVRLRAPPRHIKLHSLQSRNYRLSQDVVSAETNDVAAYDDHIGKCGKTTNNRIGVRVHPRFVRHLVLNAADRSKILRGSTTEVGRHFCSHSTKKKFLWVAWTIQ
jgi:hypothetical protein